MAKPVRQRVAWNESRFIYRPYQRLLFIARSTNIRSKASAATRYQDIAKFGRGYRQLSRKEKIWSHWWLGRFGPVEGGNRQAAQSMLCFHPTISSSTPLIIESYGKLWKQKSGLYKVWVSQFRLAFNLKADSRGGAIWGRSRCRRKKQEGKRNKQYGLTLTVINRA